MTASMVAPPPVKVVQWFGNDIAVYDLGEKVGYSWGRCTAVQTKPTDTPEAGEPQGHEHTIDCLWVWHDCDHHVMLHRGEQALQQGDPGYTRESVDSAKRFIGWGPAGVGLHTLINRLPLHIEASVYWPDCCGMHGWIRDGRWVTA